MSRRARGSRIGVLIGAGLLLFGSMVIAMVPAAAGAQHGSTPTTVPLPAATQAGHTAQPAAKTTTTTTTTTLPPQGQPTAGGIVPCPQGDPSTDTCAAMPCPTGIYCGTVVAGPTSDLGAGQFVYLNFSGFDPGDGGITIYYCSDPGGGVTLSGPPTCGDQNLSSSAENDQQVQIYPASSSSVLVPGTSEASMQAAEVAAPSAPLAGEEYNVAGDPAQGFYCDGTAANPCAIVITDATINHSPASTTANSLVLPISFAPSTSGCPNAAVVSTESEFGIDVLMPELAQLSCAGDPSTAIIPFETATDGLQAVTDLASGAQQIAFTDDPEAADQQQVLKSGHFALIPVALTANVVSFFAQLYSGTTFYNQDQMDLSPTMAAGLLTNELNYSDAGSTDDLDPCSGPSEATGGGCLFGPAPCYGDPTCSLYLQLNYLNEYEQFHAYSAFQRSDNAGVTDDLFTWLCNAPRVPLDFGDKPLEMQSGAQVLELGLTPASGPPVTTCPTNTDQVPSIAGIPRFTTVNDPNQQALKAYLAVAQSGAAYPVAAFADMNWAESRYYGMNVAALQNAAGAFVLPTAASLDAAVKDATTNPDGSLTFVNSTTDTAAYPLASVIYAAVDTDPVPQATATAESTLLTQLLNLTSGDEALNLPAGFVPLPNNLAQQAAVDITADINAVPAPVSTTPTTVATKTGTTPTLTGTGPGPGAGATITPLASGVYFGPQGTAFFSPLAATAVSSALGAPTPAAVALHHVFARLLGPALPAYDLAKSQGRMLIPWALVLGIVSVVIGMFLMSTGLLKRRKGRRAAAVPVTA
jgi:hypothetical protein